MRHALGLHGRYSVTVHGGIPHDIYRRVVSVSGTFSSPHRNGDSDLDGPFGRDPSPCADAEFAQCKSGRRQAVAFEIAAIWLLLDRLPII